MSSGPKPPTWHDLQGWPVCCAKAGTALAGRVVRAAEPTTTVPTTVSTQTGPVPKRQRRFYHLRAGETLSDVALRFNTTVDALLVLNPHVDPNALEVGQRIRVR